MSGGGLAAARIGGESQVPGQSGGARGNVSSVRIASRKLLVAALLAAFASQGMLVYADGVAGSSPQLVGLAHAGRRLWLGNNCSACHQIHGFGGFLGPDLTNAAARIPRARLDQILTVGSAQMPAFGFAKEQIDALEAYLRAVDQTGQGQARRSIPPSAPAVLAAIERRLAVTASVTSVTEVRSAGGPASDASPAADGDVTAAVRRGHELFATRCVGCHVPLRPVSLGVALAPDPASIRDRLDPATIERTLIEGRIDRGMPPAGLEPEQRQQVIAFLEWLASEREALRGEGGVQETVGLPWWEFR